jgi:NAD(P)-dependent dehydrogenase (short-subunit alcohol dehydrogenase family)
VSEHDAAHRGSVAVVTGASRGLGAGLATAFAAEGLNLGLCARTVPKPPVGSDSLCVSVDVTDPSGVDAFCAEVVERFGRIDLWINNAGVLAPIGRVVDDDPVAIRAHLDTNVLGVIYGSASFARHVRERPGAGVLVNITSGAATTPYEGWAPYCASKAAVDMFTEVIALEERDHGLRAYALAPGHVDTDMQALIRATPPELFPSVERFRRVHEEGRFNPPAHVAGYILDRLLGRTPGAPGVDDVEGIRLRVSDRF